MQMEERCEDDGTTELRGEQSGNGKFFGFGGQDQATSESKTLFTVIALLRVPTPKH